MNRHSLLLFGFVFSIACAQAADEAGSARVWLERMIGAVENQNYRGTVVYVRDGQIDSLGIVHRADADGVRERIYSLNGTAREVLRDRDEIRCVFADAEGLVVRSRLPALIPELSINRVSDTQAGYRYRLAEQERVAGRDTQIIEISPSDEFRYGHRLWLDTATGMLLRSELWDAQDRIKQQFMFTEIELGADIADSELQAATVAGNTAQLTAEVPSGSTDAKASWLPAKLPPGFQLTAINTEGGARHEHFEHLLFSDGLASFSVYLEPVDEKRASPDSSLDAVGAVNVYTRTHEDMKITVVGEVPASTVREIGHQLRPVK